MDFFLGFFSFFDDIALLIATAFGAVWLLLSTVMSRFGLAILTGLGRTGGAVIGQRFGGQMNSRRMPTNPTQRHARQALWRAEARQQRMASYVQAWFDLLATRGGPFAVSIYLHSILHDGFREKVVRLRTRCREFDRLEEIAQHRVQRYERDHERHCQPLRDELLDLEIELARLKARHARQRFRMWRKRWRRVKRRQFQTRRAIVAKRFRLSRAEWRLNARSRVLMEPALVAVDQYERAYLTHWVHSFEADLESFRLTVVTGRLIDLLFQPGHAETANRLGLADLPGDRIHMRDYIIAFLEERDVGFPPLARLEGLFEIYLRLRLLEDPALCRKWGINRIWLERYLPPPGAMGVAHERYNHLVPGDNTSAGIPQPKLAA
ncbi:MAG: hypothetical protein ACR2O4_04225 [Hyphomicrobiaceae bacterium]